MTIDEQPAAVPGSCLMTEDARSIPAGRIRRTAKVGGLLGAEVARAYATKAANIVRSEDDRKAANGRRRLEAAEHIVRRARAMKGAAMKVGQMASFIDFAVCHPRSSMAFRPSSPSYGLAPASFKDMQKVIERELGERISGICSRVRSRCGGRRLDRAGLPRAPARRPEVAVKVQYPGVAAAVRADLQNLGLILRAAKRFAPGLDTAAMASRSGSGSPRSSTTSTRRRPSVLLPAAGAGIHSSSFPGRHRALSRARARHRVGGWNDFEEVKSAPQATRDRVGEIVFRFFFGRCIASGSSRATAPGNFLLRRRPRGVHRLRHDEAVARRASRPNSACYAPRSSTTPRRARGARGARVLRPGRSAVRPVGCSPRPRPERVVRGRRTRHADPGYVSETAPRRGRSPLRVLGPDEERDDPADSLFANRMQGMTLGRVGQLRSTVNWHRLMSEWLYGSAPSSTLGKREAEFFGVSSVPAQAAA